VKVERFRYRGSDGTWHELYPWDLGCHACSAAGEYHVFDSVEPRLFFHPQGPVSRLEIAGQLELLSPEETFAAPSAALAEKQATIERLERELEHLQQGPFVRAGKRLWSTLRRRAGLCYGSSPRD
jgi:hypothetical protein